MSQVLGKGEIKKTLDGDDEYIKDFYTLAEMSYTILKNRFPDSPYPELFLEALDLFVDGCSKIEIGYNGSYTFTWDAIGLTAAFVTAFEHTIERLKDI